MSSGPRTIQENEWKLKLIWLNIIEVVADNPVFGGHRFAFYSK